MEADQSTLESPPTPWVTTAAYVLAALAVLGGVVLIATAVVGGSEDSTDGDAGGGPESLNISCFAYRDSNRNGTYDLGDRPYAALRVEGSGRNGSLATTSNSGGFANFPMLIDGAAVLVDEPGVYRFEAMPRDGWVLTSGAEPRVVEFVELAGSPAGVVATEQCEPFGLAPTLTLAGVAIGEVEVTAVDGPAVVDVVDGRFRASVSPGEWVVHVGTGAETRVREIEVVDDPVVMSEFTDRHDTVAPLANSVVMTFDEFTTANTITEIPSGYGGVDWANWVATHRILYGGPGYVNINESGEFVAYNSSGHPATVSSDEPFDFVGGAFGVAWPQAEQHDIVVRAWSGETLVHSDTFRATTAGAVYFAADYRSITRLEFSSTANWQFVTDNLELRTANAMD